LEFVDSTAVALLVNTHDAAQRDGWELSVIRGPRAVRRVFELTGTAGRLPFTGD
jgi:anti-anti-sigma factor